MNPTNPLARSLRRGLAIASVAGPLAGAQAFLFDVAATVPDGRGIGLADVRTIRGVAPGLVPSVGLSLSGLGDGMFTGDLFATLSHENDAGQVDAFCILLNRPGKRAEDAEGYADNGLHVAFTADPGAPDIHDYRLILNADHSTPVTGGPTGLWSPDGRRTDPDLVLDTDARTAMLDGFSAIDPSQGRWTLYVADVLEGGLAHLDGWSLSFSVPEPGLALLASSLGLGGWCLWRIMRQRAPREHRPPSRSIS